MIFINNFYRPHEIKLGKPIGSKNAEVIILEGYDKPNSLAERSPMTRKQKDYLLRDVLLSLLIHDKIAVRTCDVLYLFEIFNDVIDFKFLLENDCFVFFDDIFNIPSIFNEGKKNYLALYQMGPKSQADFTDSIEVLESSLNRKDLQNLSLNEQREVEDIWKRLFTLIEAKNNKLIISEFQNLIKREIEYDLKNTNFINNLKTKSTDEVILEESPYILRLAEINKTLLLANQIKVNNILIEGASKIILSQKLSPLIKNSTIKYETLDIYENLFKSKRIPDFTSLYRNKVISIEDFFKFQNGKQGKTFKKWNEKHRFDQNDILEEMLGSCKSSKNLYHKLFRWAIPNAIGMVDTLGGMVASSIDSFIVDKIVAGWHPNLFLDNVLKKELDNKMKVHDQKNFSEKIRQKFPNIKAEDKCPCGSQKSYYNCHGKI